MGLLGFFGEYGVFATMGADWTHVVALVPRRVVEVTASSEAVAGHCVSIYRQSFPGNERCRVCVNIVNQIATYRQESPRVGGSPTLVAHKGSNGEKRWYIVKDIDHWLAVQLEVFDLDDAFGPLREGDHGEEAEEAEEDEEDEEEAVVQKDNNAEGKVERAPDRQDRLGEHRPFESPYVEC